MPVYKSTRILPLLCVLLAGLSLTGCNNGSTELSYFFGNVRLYENPQILPEEFPSLFVYKKEPILQAANYGSGRYSFNRQGVIIQHSNDSQQEILEYYRKVFKKEDWQIIQSMQRADAALLMAESSSRRLLSVVLRQNDPVIIKIYNKPISLF